MQFRRTWAHRISHSVNYLRKEGPLKTFALESDYHYLTNNSIPLELHSIRANIFDCIFITLPSILRTVPG